MPRLSVITTRTGDNGTTGLGDGSRVAKNDPRVTAMGEVDELNSHLALLDAECRAQPMPLAHELLGYVKHDLFDLGGALSIPNLQLLHVQQLVRLDQWIATANLDLPSLQEFVVPGPDRVNALCHICRTVCRRAERSVVALGTDEANQLAQRYLNRLSDALFILTRLIQRQSGQPETMWQRFTPSQSE